MLNTRIASRKRGSRRVGIAMGLAVLVTVGLTSVTSASGAAASGAAAAAGPVSSTCRWEPTPAQFWVTDPTNSPVAHYRG